MKRIAPALGLFIALMVGCGNDPGATTTRPVSPGEKVYQMHCVLCHGKDGTFGISGAKDLTRSTLTSTEMTALVTDGKGAMMPYRNVLTKAEIEAVVEHVRTLQAAE